MKGRLRVVMLGVAMAAFAALPGCASHKDLKAPCSASAGSMFSSSAFATDVTTCGPMVRQNSVTLIRSIPTDQGDRAGVTVL